MTKVLLDKIYLITHIKHVFFLANFVCMNLPYTIQCNFVAASENFFLVCSIILSVKKQKILYFLVAVSLMAVILILFYVVLSMIGPNGN